MKYIPSSWIYFLLPFAVALPLMTLNARGGGGREGERSDRSEASPQMHNIERNDMKKEGVIPQSAGVKHGAYSGYGGYGAHEGYGGYGGYGGYAGYGGYGGLAAPITPGSQPGMTDDSNALYNSYLKSNASKHSGDDKKAN